MATRLYFSRTASAVAPPAPSGTDWEHASGNAALKLLETPDSSALSIVSYLPDAADHHVDGDAFNGAFVSDALAAQTITGNVKAQLQTREPNAGNNVFLTLKVLVIAGDGSSVLSTLLAITRDDVETSAVALTNRQFGSTAMGSYACAAGDRVCIEVGLGGTPSAASGVNGHNGGIQFGCSASSGDLAEDDTETVATYRPWIEFANTLTFASASTEPGWAGGGWT